MKKSVVILIILALFSFNHYAQIDTSQIIYSWKLDPYSIVKLPADIDTNLAGFQIDNPLIREYISASTLGNLSAPAISNIFTDRNFTEDYTLANAFYPYMKRPDNTLYMNTRKPFSKLTYISGGRSFYKEETLDAYHTQNVTPALNVGLHLTLQEALGQYRLQRTKNNSFRLFSNYGGKLYSYHLTFNYNRISANENGGILNDSLITDTTFTISKYKLIETLFDGMDETNRNVPDVYHEIRNINLFTIHELSFRKLFSSSDTTKKSGRIKIFYPKLAYIFSLDRTKVLFVDKNPSVGLSAGLYPDVYVDRSRTLDSLFYWKMQNALRLQFQGRKNNHYFIDIAYDRVNYSQFVPTDTVVEDYFLYHDYTMPSVSRKAQLHNTHLSSGFSRIFANALKLDLYGRYYLSGYQSGDYKLSGNIELLVNRKGINLNIKAGASNEFLRPGFLYGNFVSNNFIWSQYLQQTNITNLSCDLSLSSNRFGVQADYYLLHNLIYFDTVAFPQQYGHVLSVLSIIAQKEFTVWKFHSNNKIAFQQVSEPDVLSLPALALYSSDYLEHEFYFKATEGRLTAMIGFDLFYNTSYYANAYMPPLATFYQQKEKRLGNYPYIDVFLNIRIKRVRFFLKYEHLNSGWLEKNFFTALHYPKNQRYMKFGISWTFYD